MIKLVDPGKYHLVGQRGYERCGRCEDESGLGETSDISQDESTIEQEACIKDRIDAPREESPNWSKESW